jgi:hypothetical protein
MTYVVIPTTGLATVERHAQDGRRIESGSVVAARDSPRQRRPRRHPGLTRDVGDGLKLRPPDGYHRIDPPPDATTGIARLRRRDLLGGLLHEYELAA